MLSSYCIGIGWNTVTSQASWSMIGQGSWCGSPFAMHAFINHSFCFNYNDMFQQIKISIILQNKTLAFDKTTAWNLTTSLAYPKLWWLQFLWVENWNHKSCNITSSREIYRKSAPPLHVYGYSLKYYRLIELYI